MRAVNPKITAPKTAVLTFQLDGWAYQPPAGDQTCLGYLPVSCQFACRIDSDGCRRVEWGWIRATNGTLGPPPCQVVSVHSVEKDLESMKLTIVSVCVRQWERMVCCVGG